MNYNVAVKSKRQINKPLLTSYCSERYGCDLIDMSDFNLVLNASRRYIFVVGDYFSGMLWARGITNRMNTPANPTLSTALNDIILNDTLTVPAIIHCDNEFARGSFATYCLQHNIVLIPSSGFIERKNREIRKKIAAGIARNNDLGWLAALPQYLNNINSQVVQKTNMTPRLLWRTGLHPPGHVAPAHVPISDHMTLVDRQAYKERFLINRAHEWTSITESREFHLGDLCSISVLRLSSDLRRVRENGIGQNKISIWYSPVICSIAKLSLKLFPLLTLEE